MADVRVRFIGDATSLRNFYAQLGNETRAFGHAITKESEALAKSFFNIGQNTPVQLGRVSTTVDRLNNTFRTMAATTISWQEKQARFSANQYRMYANFARMRKSLPGFSIDDFAALTGRDAKDQQGIADLLRLMERKRNIPKIIPMTATVDEKEIIHGNNEAWLKAKSALDQFEQQAIPTRQSIKLLGQQFTVLGQQIPPVQQRIIDLQAKLNGLRQDRRGIWRDPLGRFASPTKINAEIIQTTNLLNELKNLKVLTAAEARRLGAPLTQQANALKADMLAKYSGLPPVPSEWQQLFTADKQGQVTKLLQRSGFGKGMGAQDLIGEMYSSNLRVVDDITRGVTRVSGSFADWKGRTKELSVEIDRNGKIVSRWGGNFRGLSNMLGQTVRDFQKVIEWTIATTVVFAGLRTVMQGFDIIKEIDMLLTRFSITAQTTSYETSQMFSSIKDIAVSTATPLMQLLTAMDDIAFGTRKAGQSTEQWKASILSLAEAVGIYTNLTGETAEQATENLVAVMKQLGIEAQGVIGIMNKIAAVAGGQSAAISDITKGLAVMAEAGQQAGLTTDQMIAVIKTLSLVTSKTPAEVATAFKNLVGALDNPMALKALEKYNIPVKDLEGNLRNIIDIYSEIQSKVRQGIIPTSDVKMLVRQISGGPRRAPDAAALLANIDEVQSVTEQSIAATNQALLANSEIMDTINAKWTQLTSLIQGTFYEVAGGEFGKFATDLISVSTALIPLIESFSGLIVQLIKLGALYLILRGGIGIMRAFGGALSNLYFQMTGINPALIGIAQSTRAMSTEMSAAAMKINLFGGRLGALETRLMKLSTSFKKASFVGFAGLTGAAVGGAMTGDPLGALGGGLTAAGMGLAMLPGFWTTIAGLGMTAVGTIISLNAASKESVATDKERARTIVQVADAYTEAQRTYDSALEANKNLEKEIIKLNGTENKSADQLALLGDYQKQYIANTQAMSAATVELYDAQQKLADYTGGVTQLLSEQGQVDPEKLRQIVDKYLRDIFGDVAKSSTTYTNLPGLGTGPATVTEQKVTDVQGAPGIPGYRSTTKIGVDFGDITSQDIKKIFDLATGKLKIDIPPIAENFVNLEEAVRASRYELNLTDEQFTNIMNSIKAAAAEFDPFIYGVEQIKIKMEELKALGNLRLITADEAAAMQEIYSYLAALQIVIAKGQREGNISATDANAAQNEINSRLTLLSQVPYMPQGQGRMDFLKAVAGQAVDLNSRVFPDLATAIELVGNKALFVAESFDFIPDVTTNVAGLSDAVKELAGESMDVLGGKLLELRDNIMADLASKSAETQFNLQGGQYEKGTADKQYKFEISEIEGLKGADAAIIKLAEDLKILDGAISKLGGTWLGTVEPAFKDLGGALSEIPGLENAAIMTSDELIAKLFDLGDAANLSREQWVAYLDQISKIPTILENISKIRVAFKIGADLSLVGFIKKLDALIGTLKKGGALFGPAVSVLQIMRSSVASINQQALDWGTTTSNILASGGGNRITGGGGGGSTRRSGYDVSELDLPEEIANAANRNALIQEAIRRARALQKKIPGATAEGKNDIVELLKGTQRILEVRGVKDDLLRRALEELAAIEKKRLEQEMQVSQISRLRVNAGGFALLASLPTNALGVSLQGPNGPININLNINGQVLTPAQFDLLAQKMAYYIKREMGG